MKFVYCKMSLFWIFFISLFISHPAKAAPKKSITQRINKIREHLHDKTQPANLMEITGRQFNSNDLSDWVNWNNWANWANWNNWNNWGNWGNWRNI